MTVMSKFTTIGLSAVVILSIIQLFPISIGDI